MNSSGKNFRSGKTAGMFLLGATLAFGLTLAAYIASRAALRINRQETIRVKGTAVKLVEADRGNWSGRISVRASDLTAGHAALSSAFAAAEKQVLSCGFRPEECTAGAVMIETLYKLDEKGRSTGEVRAYVLSREISAASSDIAALGRIAQTFSELLKQGIQAESTGLSYLVSNLDAYKMQLLAAATKNGLERAATLAENSGGKVGALLSASQGVFQVLAPGSGEITDCGTYDRSTTSKEIRAVVTLVFGIQ